MAITPLPIAPSRADPTNFSVRADALFAALARMVTELNNQASSSVVGNFSVSGNLLVGTTVNRGYNAVSESSDPQSLALIRAVDASATSAGAIFDMGALSGSAFAPGVRLVGVTENGANGFLQIFNRSGNALTESARFNSTGNLLVGTTIDNGSKLSVASDSTRAIGFYSVSPNALKGLVGSSAGGSSLLVADVADDFVIRGAGTASIKFGVGANEQARITSVGFFKASNTGLYGGVAGLASQAAAAGHVLQADGNTATTLAINANSGTGVMNFASYLATGATGAHVRGYVNNVLQYQVAANGAVTSPSDPKLKTSINPASPKLDKVRALEVVSYQWKPELGLGDVKEIGLISSQVKQIFPSLVISIPDRREVVQTRTVDVPGEEEVVGDDGEVVTPAVPATTREETYVELVETGEHTEAVKYSVLVPILIKALQEEADAREALEARISALEAR